MKPFAKTSLIALTSAVIGAGATAGAMKYTEHKNKSEQAIELKTPENVFDHFLKHQNQLHSQIQKRFNTFFEDQSFFKDDPFFKNDSFFSSHLTAPTSTNEIAQREDADNIYYDIKVEDPNSTTINTDVKDGQITISGTTEKKDNSESSQSLFKSTFQQTFPLPDNVDQHNMTMTTEKDKVVLKFPKLKV
jgi:HSP20 family molecular chaperone IbpA